jgi:nucleotide-binding universal stress UspA family protein
MGTRLLLAVDRFESGQAAVDFTIGLAATSHAEVRVLHVREQPNSLRVPPLESAAEARVLVEETLRRLESAGIGAQGSACSEREAHVARRIVEEASRWGCTAIVLGSLRLRRLSAMRGRGTRERVLRMSPLPVIVTPPALGGVPRTMATLSR